MPKRGGPAENSEDSLAELVPFPSSLPSAEERVELEADQAEEVVDAELVPADDEGSETRSLLYRGGELVPTGQVPEEVVLEGELVESSSAPDRRFEPRPIVPAWVLDRAQRRMVMRWFARHVGHTTAFHAVRLPKYALRALAYSPRGMGRAVASLWRWALDLEAKPLARSAIERGDVGGYLALSRQSAIRLKARLWATGVFLVLLVLVLVVGWLLWPATPAIAAAVGIGLLGWNGRRKDRPFVDPSVTITPAARRLTPDLLVHAFGAARLCTEADPITFARPIVRDGKGWLAVVDLPYGTKASTALARSEDIAAGLDIDEVQVFLSRSRGAEGSARRVTLWVADEDPYAQKPPVTPLIEVESIDFWKPVPFGLDAKGQPVDLRLVWSSLLVGAIPRMGKTFAARIPVAAARESASRPDIKTQASPGASTATGFRSERRKSPKLSRGCAQAFLRKDARRQGLEERHRPTSSCRLKSEAIGPSFISISYARLGPTTESMDYRASYPDFFLPFSL